MGITGNLTVQHKELIQTSEEILGLLDEGALSRDATHVRNLLSELSRTLTYHLTMEDDALYPALVCHPDEKIKTLSKKFSGEMGGIRDTFILYITKWPDAEAVQGSPDNFISETNEIMDALLRRIDREDNELFPLIEND